MSYLVIICPQGVYATKLKNTFLLMNITPDLPFLNSQTPFTNERIRVYLDK